MKGSKLLKGSLIYFISALLFLVLKICVQLELFDFLGKHASIYVNAFVQVGLMLALPAALYMWLNKTRPKQMLKEFRFGRTNYKVVLLSFAMGFFMFLCVIIISSMAANVWALIGYKSPFASPGAPSKNLWVGLFLPIITTAILPGFCEEFINRGLLQTSLASKMSIRKSIFFTALLFALLHFNINQAIYAFIMGLALGSIVYYTKSIWPAIIMHAVNNFCSVFFDYAANAKIFGRQFNQFLGLLYEGSAALVWIKLVAFAIVAFGCLISLMILLHRMTRMNRLHYDLSYAATRLMGSSQKTNTGEKYEGEVAGEVSGEVLVKLKDIVVQSAKNETKMSLTKIVPRQKLRVKASRLERIFLYGAVFMTATLTFFTLVWGFL